MSERGESRMGESDTTKAPPPALGALAAPVESAHPPRGASPRGIGPPWLRALLALPFVVLVQALLAYPLVAAALALSGLILPEADAGGDILLTAAINLLVCPVLWLTWSALVRASLADMGHEGPARRAVAETLLGFGGGLLVLALVVVLGAAASAWTIGIGDWQGALAAQWIWLPALLVAAYFEELLVRGWILQDLGRRSPLLGLLLSSVIFSLLHGANPNLLAQGELVALLALANIFLAGLLLGSLFLSTGRLWVPTGLHLGWNWCVAVLFGLPVSGFDLPSFLESRASAGPAFLSGGAFGPEGSVIAFLVLLPVASAAMRAALRAGRPVPVVERHALSAGEESRIPGRPGDAEPSA